MANRQISVRLAVEGADDARRKLEAVSAAGQDAQQKIAPSGKAIQDFERLERALGTTAGAAQRYEAQLARIRAAEEAGIGTAERRRQAMEAAAAAYARAAERAATSTAGLTIANDNAATGVRNLGNVIGQAGYQVQDFAVQVASGQSAVTAFAQQGSQLLGVFGTGGIIAGAALAIGAVAVKLLEGRDAAEALNDAIKAQEDIYKAALDAGERYRKGLADEAEQILTLRTAYASFSDARRRAEELRLIDRQRDLEEAGTSLQARAISALPSVPQNLIDLAASRAGRGQSIGGSAELPDQLRAAITGMLELRAQAGPSAEAVSRVVVQLQDAAAVAGDGPRGLATQLLESSRRLRDLLPEFERWEQSSKQNVEQQAALRAAIAQAMEAAQEGARSARAYADELERIRRFAAANPAAAIQSENARLEQQLDALRRRGIDGLEDEQRAQENARRVNEAANLVYEEQLKRLLDLGRGQQAAREGARAAAAEAAQETFRRNELADTLDRERKAREEADRAAERSAQEAERLAERNRQWVLRAVETGNENTRRMEERAAEQEARRLEQEARDNRRNFDETVREYGRSLADVTFSALEDGTRRGQEFFESLASGFGSLLRRAAANALSNLVFQPLASSALGGIGYTGAQSGSGSILGSVSDVFGLGSALNTLTGGGILNSLGISGGAGSLTGLLAAPVLGSGTLSSATNAALGGLGGAYGPATAAQVGAAATTWGQLLGGAGVGFTAGTLLSRLTARSAAQQTNGMIGSGAGALAGAAIGSIIPGVGTIIGGLIGGGGGGLLGGLIGPGQAFRGGDAEISVNSAGRLDVTRYVGKGETPEAIAAVLQSARQQADALNAQLVALGLRFTSGAGAYLGSGQSGNPTDLAGALDRFGVGGLTASDARVQGALDRAAPSSLSDALSVAQQAKSLAATLDGIGEPVSAFQRALNQLGDTFNPLEASARQLGFGLEALTAEHNKQSNALFRQRDEQLYTYQQQLRIRELKNAGEDVTAALAQADLSYRAEFSQLKSALEALGLSAGDTASMLARLTTAQQDERQDVERQAQDVERQAQIAQLQKQSTALSSAVSQSRVLADFLSGRELATGSPEAQFAAAQGQFDAALRAARAAGAGSADLSRVTGTAGTLLGLGSSLYASGPQFAALDAMVRSTITTLGKDLDLPAFAEDVSGSIDRWGARAESQRDQLLAAVEGMREEIRTLRMRLAA